MVKADTVASSIAQRSNRNITPGRAVCTAIYVSFFSTLTYNGSEGMLLDLVCDSEDRGGPGRCVPVNE